MEDDKTVDTVVELIKLIFVKLSLRFELEPTRLTYEAFLCCVWEDMV